MSKINTQPNSNQDNLLADFTDSALTGRMDLPASSLDPELISLENTILRLRDTFPPAQLDEGAVKGMYAKLNARIRREERQTKESFWQKWFGQIQNAPQLGVTFAAIAVLIALVVVSTSTGSSGSSTLAATAMTSGQSLVFAGVLVGAVILIIWKTRRKK